MIRPITLAATLALLPIIALAQQPQQPPDPELVQAQLRIDLGKAQFDAGQYQAKAAQLTKALAEAQAKIAELTKDKPPVADAGKPAPKKP